MSRHPTTRTWQFPPAEREASSLERINLRELVARPERFEHHLLVCATLGRTQLEIATASEPLYFAHVNLSDEYALPLPTGDALVDHFPLRTFVSDAATGEDVGRYNHRTGDVVLHPVGYLHWPGRLRPPYAPLAIPPGMRRCGLSLVFCASERAPSNAPALAPPAGREGDIKPYVTPAPPMAIAPIGGAPGIVAAIGSTTLELVERPGTIAPPRGAWVVILDGAGACDLIRVPPGSALDATGVARALVVADPDAAPDPVPPSWSALPAPPFAPFEDAAPGALPVTLAGLGLSRELEPAGLTITAAGDASVRVAMWGAEATVPRYWLARMLFRAALHRLRLGYIETYGGLYLDDGFGAGDLVLGLRGTAPISIPRDHALGVIEHIYRAVAPAGYCERLD